MQWSQDICIADEVFYSFLAARGLHENFLSSFCIERTKRYKNFFIQSAPFVSDDTFVSCFFGWIANLDIDFRAKPAIDPFCGHNPEVLACDGVHVGVAVKFLAKSTPITTSERNDVKPMSHRRFDRVFLGGRTTDEKKRRSYVIDHCKFTILNHKRQATKQLSHQDDAQSASSECESDAQEESMLFNNRDQKYEKEILSGLHDKRVKLVLTNLFDMTYDDRLLKKLARFILALTSGAPLLGYFPWDSIANLRVLFTFLKFDKSNRSKYMKQLEEVRVQYSDIMECAYLAYSEDDVLDFFLYLIDQTEKIHQKDTTPTETNQPFAPYNPSTGACYYFTETGAQIRTTPIYEIDGMILIIFDREKDFF